MYDGMPIGNDGYYISIYQWGDTVWLSLFHAGSPDTIISDQQIVCGGEHGGYGLADPTFVYTELQNAALNDDGFHCYLWTNDPAPGSESICQAYIRIFMTGEDEVSWFMWPLTFAKAPGDENLGYANLSRGEVNWTAHTGDESEFVIYTAGYLRNYHIIAFDMSTEVIAGESTPGNEIWASPTPLTVPYGTPPYDGTNENVAYWINKLNSGYVLALPRAGRWVWLNTSSPTWSEYAVLDSDSLLSYKNTAPGAFVEFSFRVTMPDLTGHTPSDMIVFAHLLTSVFNYYNRAWQVYGHIDLNGSYFLSIPQGSSSSSYGNERYVSKHVGYPNGTWTSKGVYNMTVQLTDDSGLGMIHFWDSNWPSEEMGFIVTGDNSAANGGRVELRGRDGEIWDTRLLSSYVNWPYYDYMHGSASGLIALAEGNVADPVRVDEYGNPLWISALYISTMDFSEDSIPDWINRTIPLPDLPGGNISWGLFRGQVAVANNMYKPGPSPT